MPDLAHQFQDLEQQRTADTLGMWAFLATEMMLFGAMFLGYTVYRWHYPRAFYLGAQRTDMVLGSLNTALLLTSSLSMALGVHFQRARHFGRVALCLGVTALLGAGFLALKLLEYWHHYQEGLAPGLNFHFPGPEASQVALFFVFYFVMTGLHAVHMTIGLGLVGFQTARAYRAESRLMPVTLTGLYWHFVDVIWVFLYPLFYLGGRS
ncbi:MAG TPA: cytochrome c oxidase subunit 3 [Stenomitos sp.]